MFGDYYGLNMFSQNSHVDINPIDDGIRREGLWKVIKP